MGFFIKCDSEYDVEYYSKLLHYITIYITTIKKFAIKVARKELL